MDGDDFEDEYLKENTPNPSKKKKIIWNYGSTMKLISFWGEENCLYQPLNPDYRDKQKRVDALQRIVTKLTLDGMSGLTEDEVSSKMHCLKVYFCSTRTKVNTSIKRGVEVYQVRWPFYQPLLFLNDTITPRNTLKPISTRLSRKTVRTVGVNEKHEKTEQNRAAVGLLNEASNTTENKTPTAHDKISERSADELFCDMMSKQLKTLPNNARKEFFKLEVQRLLFAVSFPTFNQAQVHPDQIQSNQEFSSQHSPTLRNYSSLANTPDL